MIADHYSRLARAPETGREERLHLRARQPDRARALVRSAAGAARDQRPAVGHARQIEGVHRAGREAGHSEDVCTYVKCDFGMMKSGNVGPTGERLPEPDLLLLSYTGCFTFMKWFEILREEYDCPVVMLHVPYQAEGVDHRADADVRRRPAARQGDPGARAGLRPQVRRGPAQGVPRPLGARRGRPRLRCSSRPSTARRRSTPTSAASTTSGRSSRRSAAPRTPSSTTGSCARRSRSACGSASAR